MATESFVRFDRKINPSFWVYFAFVANGEVACHSQDYLKLCDDMDDIFVSLWMVLRVIVMRVMQMYQLMAGQEVASSHSQSGPLNSSVLGCGM